MMCIQTGGSKTGGASCCEFPGDDQVIPWCVTNQVPGGGREKEGGGSIGKGLMAEGTGRLWFLILIWKGFSF